VHAGGDRLHALADEGLGQHGRGGGAVAGVVGSARGDFLHHLRAHVLELVGELDLLGDGHAVLGDRGRAEALVEHDVAALRAQGRLDGVGEHVDATHHLGARVLTEADFLRGHVYYLEIGSGMGSCEALGRAQPTMARMSSSRTILYSVPSCLYAEPEYWP